MKRTQMSAIGYIIEGGHESNINYGYDVKNNKYGDMMELGVIDPAKVARVVIETAASVASTVLTMECVIVPEPEVKTSQK